MAPQRRGSSSKNTGKALQGQKVNPNGKTPWSCLQCENAIGEEEETIECHRCKHWCHTECSDLSEAQYGLLARGGESLLWQCHKCIAEGASGNNTRTEAKLDVLTTVAGYGGEAREDRESKRGEKHR